MYHYAAKFYLKPRSTICSLIRSSNIGYNGMIAYDNMHYISTLLTAWIVVDVLIEPP